MRNATPPPRALRTITPPAPRWGVKEDAWEPFTPRRSNRVAAQRSRFGDTASSAHSQSQTFSPPLSPESPSKRAVSSMPKQIQKPSPFVRPRKIRKTTPDLSESDSDRGMMSKAHVLSVPSVESSGSLPTPVKTPRKRPVNKEVLASASRVLFHHRLANVEEAMPTPRKGRKSKTFALYRDVAPASPAIEVYEDSKDRIPTLDDDEDNPFITKSTTKQQPTPVRGSRRKANGDVQMDDAVRNDQGLIYVFRGKKMLRKFDDTNPLEEDDDADDNLSDLEIRRRAGVSPGPRMTRSTLKPRILFPTEEQKRAREAAAAEEADEEAVTDIEVPSPSSKRALPVSKAAPLPQHHTQLTQASIPPPLVHEPCAPSTHNVVTPDKQLQEPMDNKHLQRSKKPRSSPFDKWSRTKPSAPIPASDSKPRSNKRQASLTLEASAKRARNDV